MNNIRYILNLSGGKDSTAMAIYLRDKVPNMEYVFCDTQKELKETYEYLDRVESYLGKQIIRLNSDVGFDHWLKVFSGYLPSPNARWCTKLLKLKPFEKYVGDQKVISYVGLRYDEDRVGYISHKDNITTTFPFKEDKIGYSGVIKILKESGIGLPPYMKWGRTHSGCYFCFFQKAIEWVRLLEYHPDYFEKACQYEKTGKNERIFTWIQGMPLSELKKPERIKIIKKNYKKNQKYIKERRGNKRLVETLAGMEFDEDNKDGCLICQI